MRPFFATSTEHFSEAFPEIEDVQVNVTPDSAGWYFQNDWAGTGRYDRDNIRPQIACGNPRCRRGGFDLEQVPRIMMLNGKTEETQSEKCRGDEGSPKGRRSGPSCMNIFEVTARITYRAKAE